MRDTRLERPMPICDAHRADGPWECRCGHIRETTAIVGEPCQLCATPESRAIICPECGTEVIVAQGHG